MRSADFCKLTGRQDSTRGLLVILAYAATDCSPDTFEVESYRQLHVLLRTPRGTDFAIFAGDLNARVGRLMESERHLGDRFGLGFYRLDNKDRLLTLW